VKPLIAALSFAALSLSACSLAATQQDCMDGRARALKDGGFSGPILCENARGSFVLVGRTGAYTIYDYRYRFRPPHGAVDHGGQKILIFRGEAYLGQYPASPPPYVTVSVQGSVVRFDSADSKPIDLSNGPPTDTVLAGYDVTFFR